MLTLYNNDARFLKAYMEAIPGYYDTGDAGIIDSDGYVHVMSRTDDVINVAGHRLSCGAMEEVRGVFSVLAHSFLCHKMLHICYLRICFQCI
jgi:acyl-coenzyme A synthetase/AMP-(fatty) acid ligase